MSTICKEKCTLDAIYDFSCGNSDNKEKLSSVGDDSEMMKTLCEALKTDIDLSKALSVLYHISGATSARMSFTRIENILIQLLITKSSETQLMVTNILRNLSNEKVSCHKLLSNNMRILTALTSELGSALCSNEVKKNCLVILKNLSYVNQTALSNVLSNLEVNIIHTITTLLSDHNNTEEEKKSCLVIARIMSDLPKGISFNGSDQQQLLSSLKFFLDHSFELVGIAVSVLLNISKSSAMLRALLSFNFGFVSSFIEIIKTGTNEIIKKEVISILVNLSVENEDGELLKEHLDALIDAIFEEMKTQSDSCHTIRLKSSMLLWNLSLGNKAIEVLNSKKEKYIPVLFELLRNETNEELLKNYMTVIKNLSYHPEMKIYLGNEPNGWISLITHHLIIKNTELISISIALMASLSSAEINLPYLSSDAVNIASLVFVHFKGNYEYNRFESIKEENLLNAITLTKNIASIVNKSTQAFSAIRDSGLVSAIVRYLRGNLMVGLTQLKKIQDCITCVHMLTNHKNCLKYFGSGELGLLEIIVKLSSDLTFIINSKNEVSDSCEENIRSELLSIMMKISNEEDIQTYMGSPALGLLQYLIEVIKDGNLSDREKSLITIRKLSNDHDVCIFLGLPNLGLLHELVKVLESAIGTSLLSGSLLSGLVILKNMAVEKSLRSSMGDPKLIVCLKKISRTGLDLLLEDKNKNTKIALATLCYIASGQPKHFFIENRPGEQQPGVLNIICDTIRRGSMDEQLTALEGIQMLTLSECTNLYLLKPQLGLISSMLNFPGLSTESGSHKLKHAVVAPLWNIVERGDESDVKELIKLKVHETVLKILKTGLDQPVSDESQRTISVCLNFLMNLARHEISIFGLIEKKAINVLKPIIADEKNGIERTKALFVMIFLVGRKENGILDELLKGLIDKVIEVFKNTLEGKGGHDYPLGTFCLKLIVHACLDLSVSDKNKEDMVQQPFLNLLVQTLNLYVNEAPPIPNCGGGGNDHECAELAIETLLQLSFTFDDSQILRKFYMTPKTGVQKLMTELCTLSKLSLKARQSANLLLGKLVPETDSKIIGLRLENSVSPRRLETQRDTSLLYDRNRTHIMMSYCWNSLAKPEYVKRLGNFLRNKLNYDIWRDEIGSTILEPMGGDVYNRMAEAVEKSSHLIICVSKQYKESANCRMEAEYAVHLQNQGKSIKILYVMMQEDYTTTSTDPCDGWLGIMIGGKIWYPMWDSHSIPDTAHKVSCLLGESSKLVQYSSFVDQSSTVSPVTPSNNKLQQPNSLWSPSDCHPYYYLLSCKNKKITSKLMGIGVNTSTDFDLMESHHLDKIKIILNSVQEREFQAVIERRAN